MLGYYLVLLISSVFPSSLKFFYENKMRIAKPVLVYIARKYSPFRFQPCQLNNLCMVLFSLVSFCMGPKSKLDIYIIFFHIPFCIPHPIFLYLHKRKCRTIRQQMNLVINFMVKNLSCKQKQSQKFYHFFTNTSKLIWNYFVFVHD